VTGHRDVVPATRWRRGCAAGAGLALACALANAGALSAPAIASAADARDLEANVNANAERARGFGKASAGTAPPPGGTPGGAARGAPGEICLLGVCTQGASKRADPVPGWVGMDKRSFALAMVQDFLDGYNCISAQRHRKELASMRPPRNEAERQRQQRERDSLNKELQIELNALKGVDCAKVLQ